MQVLEVGAQVRPVHHLQTETEKSHEIQAQQIKANGCHQGSQG